MRPSKKIHNDAIEPLSLLARPFEKEKKEVSSSSSIIDETKKSSKRLKDLKKNISQARPSRNNKQRNMLGSEEEEKQDALVENLQGKSQEEDEEEEKEEQEQEQEQEEQEERNQGDKRPTKRVKRRTSSRQNAKAKNLPTQQKATTNQPKRFIQVEIPFSSSSSFSSPSSTSSSSSPHKRKTR